MDNTSVQTHSDCSTPKRWCYYVDESMGTPLGYVPAVVTENEPGFAPLIGKEGQQPWYWGHDIDTARRAAERANSRRGLTAFVVDEIVGSSIMAQIRDDAARELARDRWDDLRAGHARSD